MSERPFVRLYGGPLLMTDEGPAALTPTQRRLLAVTYLDAPDPVSREEVAWLLWESGETAEVRHRIRQLIYAVNRASSEPALERQGDLVVPCLRADVRDVEPNEALPLRLVTSGGTASFEHWLDRARNRLTRKRRERLAGMLDDYCKSRDLESVARVTSMLVECDPPGSPGVIRDHLWALQGLGRHRQAERFMSGLEGSSASHPGLLAAVTNAMRITGRPLEPEVGEVTGQDDLLTDVVHRLLIEDHGGVLLFGPTAIGKSTVLAEVKREIVSRFHGHAVFSTSGRSVANPQPFGLCQELLLGESARTALLDHPSLLTPTLRAAFPWVCTTLGIGSIARIDPEPEAISRDFASLVKGLVRNEAVVFVLDDVDLADPSSLRLLLDTSSRGLPSVKFLGAVTATDAHGASAIARGIEPRLADLVFIPVTEIGLEHSVSLILKCDDRLSQDDARRMYRALGGIPGYLIEAASTAEPGDPLPRTVHDLVERRLFGLGSLDRVLCSALSVGGSPTTSGTLARVIDHAEHLVSAAIERLIEAAVLRRRDQKVWFTQAFLASGSYARLSESERRAFHRRFLTIAQADTDTGSTAIRRHAAASGEPPDALHSALVREAEAAEAQGALEEAARLWAGARSTSDSLSAESDAVIRSADVLIRLRQYDEAFETVEEFLEHRSQSIDNSLEARLRLRSFSVRSRKDPSEVSRTEVDNLLLSLEAHGRQVDLAVGLETGLRVADAHGDPEFLADLLSSADQFEPDDPQALTWVLLARTRHLYFGDPERGLSSARLAVQTAIKEGRPGLLARTLNRLIVALVFRGRLASREGSETISKARELARQSGDTLLLYDTFVNEGSWLMDIGNLEAAEDAFARAKELVGPAASRVESLTTRVNQGELFLHQGKGIKAQEEFSAALTVAEGESAGALLCAAGLSLANLEAGRLSAAREWALQLHDVDPHDRFRGNVSLVALALARLAQAEGRATDAIATLLTFASAMLPWMVPAAVKLYLEAFRLALRTKVQLEPSQILPVVSVVRDLGIPVNGERILRLQDRLLP